MFAASLALVGALLAATQGISTPPIEPTQGASALGGIGSYAQTVGLARAQTEAEVEAEVEVEAEQAADDADSAVSEEEEELGGPEEPLSDPSASEMPDPAAEPEAPPAVNPPPQAPSQPPPPRTAPQNPAPAPFPPPAVAPAPAPVPPPAVAPAPPRATAPTCTQFIGYSQTDQWFSAAEGVLGSERYQLLQNSGGATIRWADPGYAGWRNAVQSPCARNATAPDRVVMDITHYDYLTSSATGGDPVGFMERIIRNVVTTIRNRYPSARQIVLQPVVGGPGGTACPWRGAQEGAVRASYNHPFISQAAGRVVGGEVVLGPDMAVRTCADYADDQGHLTDSARGPIGRNVAQFYLQN